MLKSKYQISAALVSLCWWHQLFTSYCEVELFFALLSKLKNTSVPYKGTYMGHTLLPPLLSSNLYKWEKIYVSKACYITLAHQALLSIGFFRQEYWSGLPSTPLQGVFLTQGLNQGLMSPALVRGLYHQGHLFPIFIIISGKQGDSKVD